MRWMGKGRSYIFEFTNGNFLHNNDGYVKRKNSSIKSSVDMFWHNADLFFDLSVSINNGLGNWFSFLNFLQLLNIFWQAE